MLSIRFSDKTKQYPVDPFEDKTRPTFFSGYLKSDMKTEVLDLSDYNSRSMDILYYLYAVEDYNLKDIKYYIENFAELQSLADFLLMEYVLDKVDNTEILPDLLKDETDEDFLLSLPDTFIEVKDSDKCEKLFLQIYELKYITLANKFYSVNKINLDNQKMLYKITSIKKYIDYVVELSDIFFIFKDKKEILDVVLHCCANNKIEGINKANIINKIYKINKDIFNNYLILCNCLYYISKSLYSKLVKEIFVIEDIEKCKRLFISILRAMKEKLAIDFYIINKTNLDKLSYDSCIQYSIFKYNLREVYTYILKNKTKDSKILYLNAEQFKECLNESRLIYEEINWNFNKYIPDYLNKKTNQKLVERIIKNMSNRLVLSSCCDAICNTFNSYPPEIIIKFVESVIVSNKLSHVLKHKNINKIIYFVIRNISDEKINYWRNHEKIDDIIKIVLENLNHEGIKLIRDKYNKSTSTGFFSFFKMKKFL
jgi:hypothetical protein